MSAITVLFYTSDLMHASLFAFYFLANWFVDEFFKIIHGDICQNIYTVKHGYGAIITFLFCIRCLQYCYG